MLNRLRRATDKLRMRIPLASRVSFGQARRRCRWAAGIVAALFLTALAVFIHESLAVRTVYWTLCRAAAAVTD